MNCRQILYHLSHREAQSIIAATHKSLQSCLTLCDPIDGTPPGSPIPGILQARVLEWVAISFSNAWKWKVKVKSLSHIPFLATPWTAANQAPPSIGFSSQEYWSGVPLPSSRALLEISECLGLVHGDDPERWYGVGGGRGIQDWELVYTRSGFMSMYGKTNTVL